MKPPNYPSRNPTLCPQSEKLVLTLGQGRGKWEVKLILNFLSFHRVTSEVHFYSVVQEGCEQKIFPNGTCSADLIISATKSYLYFCKGSLQKEILFNAEVTCTTVECVLYTDFELIFACTRIFTAFQSSQKQFFVM